MFCFILKYHGFRENTGAVGSAAANIRSLIIELFCSITYTIEYIHNILHIHTQLNSVCLLSNHLLVEAPEFLLCSSEFQDLNHCLAVLISTQTHVTWSKVSGRLVLTVSGTVIARMLPRMETMEKM